MASRPSVYYNLSEDRSLPEATRLREAFAAYFASAELADDWPVKVMACLKAFTHFNRLAMLRRLSKGEASKAELEAAAGVVVKTVEHHLRILTLAKLVMGRIAADGSAVYRLLPQEHPVARELLNQALGGRQSYFNSATGSEKNLRLIHGKDGNRGFVRKKNSPIYD